MSQATFTRLVEKDCLVSSGSDLLDSFYHPVKTTTCLQNEPVVDVETILEAIEQEAIKRNVSEQDVSEREAIKRDAIEREQHCRRSVQPSESPRNIAVRRLTHTLNLDRVHFH
ncbi:MAG: hypothetical protein AB8B99_03980 [Phormidesmis sp.]